METLMVVAAKAKALTENKSFQTFRATMILIMWGFFSTIIMVLVSLKFGSVALTALIGYPLVAGMIWEVVKYCVAKHMENISLRVFVALASWSIGAILALALSPLPLVS